MRVGAIGAKPHDIEILAAGGLFRFKEQVAGVLS